MRLAQLLILEKQAPQEGSHTYSEEENQLRKRNLEIRTGKVSLSLPEKKKRGAMHVPEAMALKDAQCCHNPDCTGKTCIHCTECKIFLCVLKHKNCFLNFRK